MVVSHSPEDANCIIFANFLEHLLTSDGGHRESKSSLQTVTEVKTVLTYLGNNFADLLDRRKVRSFFHNYFDLKRKPGTSKHYISSLISFMDYGISDELIISDECNEQKFIAMRLRLCQWRKSYEKLIDNQKWMDEEDLMEVLITPEQIAVFQQGVEARSAVKLLGQVSSDPSFVPTTLEFTKIRDYILTTLALLNAHRSGVSANMTMDEFKRAKHEKTADKWIISVRKHKTYRKHGPAVVCLPSHEYNILCCYVDKIRPHINCNVHNVFTSFKGNSLESGGVSKQINAIWKRSGVYGEKRPPKKNVSTTVIRKLVTTLVHENHMEKAQPVADLLAHDVHTAKKSYRVRNRQKQAIAGSAAIQEAFQIKQPESSLESPRKRKWEAVEKNMLLSAFSEEINNNEISMAIVRDRYATLETERTERQIYDKLRKMVSLKDNSTDNQHVFLPVVTETLADKLRRILPEMEIRSNPEAAAVSDDDDSILPPTILHGSVKLFSAEETELIEEVYHDIIDSGTISIERIERSTKNAVEHRDLLKTRFTSKQIQNKIKYLRRKKPTATVTRATLPTQF